MLSQLRFYHVRGLTVFLVFIASMLLGFSLTTEPFLSRSSSSSYLLRTDHGYGVSMMAY